MSVCHSDLLTKLETTCGRLLLELQEIWVEVGETDDTKESMLLEIERQCLDVYRKKVDHAYQCRAQKRQAIADSEAELAKIYSTLGIHPVHIMQSAGFSGASNSTGVSILLGVFKLIMTGVAVLAVDRLGRRRTVASWWCFWIGAYYTFLGSAPAVAVVALLFYVGCYKLSFGPIGWLMISEIFPLRMRGRGLSIAVLVNFSANALVTFSFSPLKALIGAGNVFFVFGVIAVLSLFFIFYVIPEIKGLSLEEIEAKIG